MGNVDIYKGKNKVGIVTDHPLRMAVNSIRPWRTVGPGGHHVLERGMPIDRHQTATEGAGRDRGDVVDEPLRRQLRELHAHVTAEGDDVVSPGRKHGIEHPVFVRALEEQVAELLDKPGALFMPSGTMANQVAIHVHCRPGDELICEERSHVFYYEGGAIARLSGTQVRTLVAQDGFPTPSQVQLLCMGGMACATPCGVGRAP